MESGSPKSDTVNDNLNKKAKKNNVVFKSKKATNQTKMKAEKLDDDFNFDELEADTGFSNKKPTTTTKPVEKPVY